MTISFDEFKKKCTSMGVPERFIHREFFSHPAMLPFKSQIKDWLKNPCNVILTGDPGNGKTTTACCMFCWFIYINQYIWIYFRRAEDLYSEWRDACFNRDDQCLKKKISECELFFLDDIGQGEITDSYKKWLYNLIDSRSCKRLPTIVTTNLKSDKLNEIFGQAIFSRLCENSMIFEFKGTDQRMQNIKKFTS